jgi:hypothetical protein
LRRLVEREVVQPVEPPRVDPAVPALEHQRVAALLQQHGDERRVARRPSRRRVADGIAITAANQERSFH